MMDGGVEPFKAINGGNESAPDKGSAHVLTGDIATRLILSGDIDVAAVPDLREALAAAVEAGLPVRIEARHVTFMDSSGITLLAQVAAQTPKPCTIVDPPDVVRFLLDVTRIGDLVTVTSSNGNPPDIVA